MKILFVATRKNSDPLERELYEMDFMNRVLGFKRSLLDLGLQTVIACTPPEVDTEFVDEYFQDIPYDTDADFVALSAKTSCVVHVYEVADEFRRRGKKVILGGIHASLRPDEALMHVDTVVIGEAELVWPECVRDAIAGKINKRYEAKGFPPMEGIPVPAWDKLRGGDFLFHQIQTTRGCPFKCRFCSVPDIAGSDFRFKPIERVINEIKSLPRAGKITEEIKALYFVDDNFLSRPKYTKDLLRALIPLRKRGEVPNWSAETTLNVARDEELLDLFAAAGCTTLIIGFESISSETLNAMNKGINYCLNYHEAIHNIHVRGMSIVGNFIVGFDTDTISVFHELIEFIDENAILYPFFSILTPMPGTALHDDFKRDGRLDHFDWGRYDTRHVVYDPKHMTRDQLLDGYIWLYEKSYCGERAINRLKKHWQTYSQVHSSIAERMFLKWKLRHEYRAASPELKSFHDQVWHLLADKKLKGNASQFMYYLDSGDFTQFMIENYRSSDWREHYKIFESGENPGKDELTVDTELLVKQWESKKLRQPKVAGR